LETIRRLGCVQLDTISVISRSHETVLWSRLGPYRLNALAELYEPDRALIEYWGHAAAILPVETFPYFRRAMARHAERDGWIGENRVLLDRVLATIRERGPVASRDFDPVAEAKSNPWDWWGGKPERRALDALWSMGDLVVVRRNGFQRVFDLTERALPGALAAPIPGEAEQRRFFARKALIALGVATPRWIADYFRTGGRAHVPMAEAKTELAALEVEGSAIRLDVAKSNEPFWLAAEHIPTLELLRSGRGRPTLTTLLSPFDSLVWHRGRALTLFGFDYRLESYTPAARRRYGYYTLPILHRGRIVGRLDPSYDRRNRMLTVRALHLEPWVAPKPDLAAAIVGSLRDLVTFLGGDEVRVLTCDPAAFTPHVAATLMSPEG
jgi:uncharacterized protein YcaQ